MEKGRVIKSKQRLRHSKRLAAIAFLRMLSATDASSSTGSNSGGTSPMTAENAIHDFLTTGRTGRRNALPDILGDHATESTSDLPEKLEALTCSTRTTDESSKASTSSAGQTAASQCQSSSQPQPGTSGEESKKS